MGDTGDARRPGDGQLHDHVQRRLETLFGRGRLGVHVDDGHVVLCDHISDHVEHHLATTTAMVIPGVRSVDVLVRADCPHHETGSPTQ